MRRKTGGEKLLETTSGREQIRNSRRDCKEGKSREKYDWKKFYIWLEPHDNAVLISEFYRKLGKLFRFKQPH
jgi:hypothetical protein